MDTRLNPNVIRGATSGLPFVLVLGPFGMLFGVVATEAGLNIAQVMGFTVLVIAGAAQVTALQLLQDDAPTLIVLVTALAVNMRMAMYSAALVPYLGGLPFWKRAAASYVLFDQNFAMSQPEFENRPDMTLGDRLAFHLGVALPLVPIWIVATLVGALAGKAIPPEYALDFAVPITFIALIAPALRTLPHVLAALTSVLAALALAWVPFGLGLIVAALLALAVGASSETWLESRSS